MGARTDAKIRDEVGLQLRSNPIDSSGIVVAVEDGTVTLTGFVRRYAEKCGAERAVQRVAGVVRIANDLDVHLPVVDWRPDTEIMSEVVEAIRKRLPVSSDRIKVVVKNGWISLEGDEEWPYQKASAENAVRWIKGVRGVSNLIQVKPRGSVPAIGWGP